MSYPLLLLLVNNVKRIFLLMTAEQKTEPIDACFDTSLDSQITGKAAFTQKSFSSPLVASHPLL